MFFKRKEANIRCWKCNTELPHDAKFCSYCGNKVGEPIKCPKCGNECQPGSKFCIKCGTPLAEEKCSPEKSIENK